MKAGLISIEQLRTLPAAEQQHFTRCEACGEWFDQRDLNQVVFHCFDRHTALPDLPHGGWARVEGSLPNEPRPEMRTVLPLRRLRAGTRVYVEYCGGAERIAGWGILRRCTALAGWEVDFENGSAVGMSAEEMRRRCVVAVPATTKAVLRKDARARSGPGRSRRR